jgi:hypothetical protein
LCSAGALVPARATGPHTRGSTRSRALACSDGLGERTSLIDIHPHPGANVRLLDTRLLHRRGLILASLCGVVDGRLGAIGLHLRCWRIRRSGLLLSGLQIAVKLRLAPGVVGELTHFLGSTRSVSPVVGSPLVVGCLLLELVNVLRVGPGVDELNDVGALVEHLVGYVYTRDTARGQRMIDLIDTGMMGLNVGVVSNAAGPFGGVKQSGLGREGGTEGIYEYLETKYTLMPNPYEK